MSKEALEGYLAQLESQPELREELDKLLGTAPGKTALTVAEFAALGARHGFQFGEEDLAAAQTARELSERQLDAVAAGAAGKEQQHYTIQLVNASIAGVRDGFQIQLVNATLRR